jgi:hypothetical protein
VQRLIFARTPYISDELCLYVLDTPDEVSIQPDGRVRHWRRIRALGNRVLRVVTLADRITVHNAFLDRSKGRAV